MKPDYFGYEAAKAAWVRANPDHSPRKYEEACKALAQRFGV